MTNKLKIIIGIVVVLLLGGSIYSISSNGTIKKQHTELSKLDPNSGIMCEQTEMVGEDNNSVTTIFYIHGNKMRYDAELAEETQGQKDIHMINDGEYSYLWGKGIATNMLAGQNSNNGIKLKDDGNPENDSFTSSVNIKELEAEDFKAPGLSCKKWKPDASLFELPKDITFTDMEEMMSPLMNEKMQESMNTNTGSMDPCDICNMVPDGQAKQECLSECK